MKIESNPSGNGLTVEVKDLFYNTPARKKFLKSNFTEIGHVSDFMAKYALACPQIAFKFVSDGKTLLSSGGTGKLSEAVVAVYGAELARELTALDHQFPAGRVSGLVSRPTLTRMDKNYETFFVNGRFIRNFLLNRALEEAYRTLIPGGRYPVGIVFIELDPRQVDVNVHPTKREVKFLKNQEVMDAVRQAAEKALGGIKDTAVRSATFRSSEGLTDSWKPQMMDIFFKDDGGNSYSPIAPAVAEDLEFKITAVQPLLPLYQLKNTYIAATDGEELVIIDQHAAHERILYDQLSLKIESRSSQTLLTPETIELSAPEAMALRENLAYLKNLGFDLEEFGGSSFLLRAVPSAAGKTSFRQLIGEVVSETQNLGKSVQLEVKQESIRKLIACHSAVKAGDKLTPEEMNRLIKDLYATQNPLTCPHGRPTMMRVTEDEMKKRLGR